METKMLDENAHFHWKFIATDTGNVNPATVSVIGYLDEQSALEAVKDLVKRENYRLEQVWECNQCRYQEYSTSFQKDYLEGQNKILNALKKWMG
jgi:hypothetical protein